MDVYEQLIEMGFPSGVAAAALKQTNSDLQLSLEAIQSHGEWYDLPDVPLNQLSPDWSGDITDEMLAQVISYRNDKFVGLLCMKSLI